VIAAQTASGSPFVAPLPRRTIDPKSPLFEGFQNSPWLASYKPITNSQVQRKIKLAPIHYELRSSSSLRRGNETVLAKPFVIAAEGDALAWHSMLKLSTIYSLENLRNKILANF
jgi:hypothetical protein